MAKDLFGVKRFLFELLTGDAALSALIADRVFPDVAAQETPCPYIVFSFVAGNDRNGLGGKRILTRPIYAVKVVGLGGYEEISEIYDLVDTLLTESKPTAVDGQIVMSCVREQPFAYPEVDDTNTRYSHLGGNYRLQVQRG